MAISRKDQVQLSELRRRLSAILSGTDDAAFLRMVWALNALQTGRAESANRFLDGYPAEAATVGIIGPSAIYPWELETVVNELLTTKKSSYQLFRYRDWNAIREVINLLRGVENAEYGSQNGEPTFSVEMGRIGARQFPWQRGYVGLPQLYRNAFIYGQGECASYLRQTAGLSSSQITLVGFSLLAVFYPEPTIRPATDMTMIQEWGIGTESLSRVLDRLSCPLAAIRRHASDLRQNGMITAYKSSILRRFPCVRVGHRNRTLMAPLPELIMDRVTNGLFYDVVGGGGVVRDEIGKRFEAYSLDLLRAMLAPTQFTGEVSYQTRLGAIATPDILMYEDNGDVQLAIECKASRMSVAARFGDAPEEDRGYEEIAKGVMQLWRFFAHCRQQAAPQELAPHAQGMILTLDEWFAGRSTVIPQIIAQANVLADLSAHKIPHEDRRPVAFCTISELEDVLTTGTSASLQDAIRLGSGDRAGWIFSILHSETSSAKTTPKDYPFQKALGDLLPWYARLAELKDDEE